MCMLGKEFRTGKFQRSKIDKCNNFWIFNSKVVEKHLIKIGRKYGKWINADEQWDKKYFTDYQSIEILKLFMMANIKWFKDWLMDEDRCFKSVNNSLY